MGLTQYIDVANDSDSVDIELLRRLSPPEGLIHVGAGFGINANGMHHWQRWSVPRVLVIDAAAERLDWTKQTPNWQNVAAVIAEKDEQVPFYCASNPNEDGLVDIEILTALWPNLSERGQQLHQAMRLDSLLLTPPLVSWTAHSGLWLILDCLPAMRLLAGAEMTLTRCDVVWARVVLKPCPGLKENASFDSCETFLKFMGFRCVRVRESNHPDLADALFVRDWHEALRLRAQQTAELETEAGALREQLVELDALRLKAQQTAELETEAGALREQLVELDALRLKAQQTTELETEAGALREQLTARDYRIGQLEEAMAQREACHRLLEDALTKSEAQINLIKHLLLPEHEL